MMDDALVEYSSNLDSYCLDRIARFHLEFENIHPFCDGNGRLEDRRASQRAAAQTHCR